MPLHKWEPLDFIDVLGVAPFEGEYGIFYEYVVERQCCRLVVKVWPLDSDISIELYVAGQEEGREPRCVRVSREGGEPRCIRVT